LPWFEHPFSLISWLDMNRFGAEKFFQIAGALSRFEEMVTNARTTHGQNRIPNEGCFLIHSTIGHIKEQCEAINLRQSAKCADRILKLLNPESGVVEIEGWLSEMSHIIHGEMEDHLFFWVPGHRADFYGKKAHEIAGNQWSSRFTSTIPEIEESAKCYAAGRYTASAFHLMRAAEGGTKALGLAVGLTPMHPGWKLVFEEVYAQYKKQKPRHQVWNTHEASLIQISGDLRTISHVWRNDLAHFVDTYNEDEAREMFIVVPMFMRNLSAMIDESGKLY
jgi:hypothetical protein